MSKRKKAHQQPVHFTAPPAEGKIIDSVMAIDRAYFEAHPGEACFLRDPIVGEFWPQGDPPPGWAVLVEQMAPGIRRRRLLRGEVVA